MGRRGEDVIGIVRYCLVGYNFNIVSCMGKLKTKYPLELEIDFMLFLQTSELIRDSYIIELHSGDLEFEQVKGVFTEFMSNHQISYEAYMFFQTAHSEREELLHVDWCLSITEIEDNNRYIIIKVKSHTQHLKELLYEQISEVSDRLNKLQEKMNSQTLKQDQELKSPYLLTGSPSLYHNNSISQVSIPTDKDLDIGVLFSQPIFDQKKHKEANMPVDFRSELQRLYSALNNSYKPEITVECQIATRQHLRHLIGYKKPKILHIICHGSKDGQLQFQDDSKFSIGALSLISSQKIRMILQQKKDAMPSLVFINSCHSQLIGKIFYECGVKYCIMIDSQDKIDDEAAQIFSENFYRNIFRGEKVGIAFRQAKDTVKLKHNSSGCCCRHTAREKHKENCRWLQLCQTMGEYQAHKIYHIPSQKCNCQLRSINQHDLTCEWAQFALFHINNDFRIKDGAIERFPKKKAQLPKYLPSERQKQMLLICCCFNFEDDGKLQNKSDFRIPHSESNKFKMLPANPQTTQSLYQLQKNVAFRTQIIDYSAPELTQYYQKVQNSSVMGRQQELYQFMKIIKDNQISFYFLYGHPGIGKTTFAIKASTYLIERRVFEIYFFVDLYDIKDRDMFRNKFNQVTKFDYPYNKNSFSQIKTKPMIIVFDNVDQFLLAYVDEFQDELQNLKKQFSHTKFILTCKEKNISVLQNEPIFMNNHSIIKELKVLDGNTAAKALYMKIRNYLDISISFLDIRELVEKKAQLQIPKIIENLSHSFSHTKGKVKLEALKQKVSELGQGDLAFNKLVQENLNILKARCKMSYQMLIFISQFSQGIDKNDFSILGSYDRSDNKVDNLGAAFIDIPIDKNWKKRLANLFQKHRDSNSDVSKTDSQSQTLESYISLQKHQTTISREDIGSLSDDQNMFYGDSYFLQELSRNRYIVKRFIRDFIWNKDKSEQNYYMKHIFVAYTAVMLDIYLDFLVKQNYIHEELLEYSDISQCGIFKFKDNNYKRPLLTQSVRYVEDYNSKFERILKQQPALREKIKNSDPSVFIMNHKLDFLHIYGYDWTKVYEYLHQSKRKQASILINYLQRLIILIPTAMKVANMQQTLIKYSIRQSITLLNLIRKYSKPAHTLILTLKLKLMKAASQVEKGDDACLPNNMDFQRDYHKTDLEVIEPEMLKLIQKQWSFENQILQIYLQYLKIKTEAKSLDNPMKVAERITEAIRNLQQLNGKSTFQSECQCQVLIAKRQLLQAMIYNKILEVSVKYPTNFKIANFKNNANLISCIKNSLQASKVFYGYQMMKLSFRAKLLALSINWQQLKTRVKQNEFSREMEREKTMLRECQEIYEDKNNNLIGLTVFDGLMKKIRKQMKEKMWQDSANNLVMMKAVPLSNKNMPLLQHVVRNKQIYRRQLQSIFLNAQIDLSIKFQILTAEKLEEQTKRQSTILLLTTSFRVMGGKVFLICEDVDLKEKDIEINAQFYQKYPIFNTKLLILMGSNATQGFKKLTSLFPQGPSIIAITSSSTSQFDQFQQYNYEDLSKNTASQLKKVIEHHIMVEESQIQFAKSFIKSLINLKNYQKGIKDIYAELWHQNKQSYKNFKIQIRECSKDIIKMIKGNFKDLSPSFRKTHNIDYELKSNGGSCVYRKWKQLNEVFKQFSTKKQTKYIQICGSNGVGKSTFIQEIGRICIQRNFFQSGVYIFNGKQVEEKYQSDFETYITKASQASNMFNLQSFNKYANSNFLLIIDDFHLIKPRSNGRYNLFLKKLIEKKVNLIFVTHENFYMRDLLPSISIKKIKIQNLKGVELDIFAYHVFRAQNTAAIEEYEHQKLKRTLNCPEIIRIHEKNIYPRPYNFMKTPEQSMRKLVSNKN